MEKNLNVSILLDFYGAMLTEKQREAVEYYYNDDLSLSEIADNQGISRQGVRDVIVRAEAIMTDLEDKTGLMKRFLLMQQQAQAILDMRLKALQGLEREKLQNEYDVEGVPAMGVAGRYYTDGTKAGNMENVLRVVNALVASSRKA